MGIAAEQSSMLGSKLRMMPSKTLIAMAIVTSCSFKRTCAKIQRRPKKGVKKEENRGTKREIFQGELSNKMN
jgi:hypothetical protein